MANLKLENVGKKSAWLYPEVQGTNPPERWGHSACFSQGMLYVFGGCRGGLHFSDVMSLDLTTMSWSSFACTGQQPGTRDSHTAVLQGRRMIIFGGTNGSKKINDVHILDLDTHVWSNPTVDGQPPPARESHSATLVDGNKVVIFGGSGEGEGNYLNDIHFLELDRMQWVSPSVKGELPVCRDSHTAVAVKDQLIVYGGDCGDRYLSEVDVFNLRTFTWSKVDTTGSPQPAVRAGHVAVAADNKVYVFGGVGDRAYYNDVWVLDIALWKWSQLEVTGLQPQGRFSHVAVMRDDDIAIYGGCGEDERPLDEVLVLHLGIEQLNPEFPKCRFVQTVYDLERRKPSVEVINDDGLCDSEKTKNSKELNLNKSSSCQWKEDFLKLSSPKPANLPFPRNLGDMSDKSRAALNLRARTRKLPFPYMDLENGIHAKRRKTSNLVGKLEGVESEQDEASPTMSQHSSPTLSDQDKSSCQVPSVPKPSSRPPAIFLQHQQEHLKTYQEQQQQPQHMVRIPTLQLQLHLPGHQTISLPVHDTAAHLHSSHPNEHVSPKKIIQQQQQHQSCEKRNASIGMANVVGSEVRGIVDGAFDSGYLMTAQVNGQVFRGILFCPGPMHAAVHRGPPPHAKPQNGSNVASLPVTSSTVHPVNGGTIVGYPVHFSSPTSEASSRMEGKCGSSSSMVMLDSTSKNCGAAAGFQGVVIPATTTADPAAVARPVQVMGSFPAVLAGQSGRWVFQPHEIQQSNPQQQQHPPQSQENHANLNITASFPPIHSITLAPAAAAHVVSPSSSSFYNNLVKNPAASSTESELQPAVTLSLGQSSTSLKN